MSRIDVGPRVKVPCSGSARIYSLRVDFSGPSQSAQPSRQRPWLTVLVAGGGLLLLAAAVTVGADALWLVALGDRIGSTGRIPTGVPFAAADSAHWVNLPVLGELIFAGLHHLGSSALPAAQLIIDGALLAVTALSARRLHARDGGTAVALLLVMLGALPALGVVRAQMLSLLPFALLVLLLRAEHARPSRRILLMVPLLALWGNLHGAVLVGAALSACYLIFSRARSAPVESVALLIASAAALWLNPAGAHTASYYASVLGNEAAHRGTGLWARLNPGSPFDLLLMLTALVLVALTVSCRRPAWEYVATAGLALATVTASRHGLWLLLFCAAPAAARLSRLSFSRARAPRTEGKAALRGQQAVAVVIAAAISVGVVSVLVSRRAALSANDRDAAVIRTLAAGRVVLATEPLAETLAADGVRVWLSNPIDAFSRTDQSAYLDFLAGHGPGAARALSAAELVVVSPGSAGADLAARAGFAPLTRVGGFEVLARG